MTTSTSSDINKLITVCGSWVESEVAFLLMILLIILTFYITTQLIERGDFYFSAESIGQVRTEMDVFDKENLHKKFIYLP